MLRARKFWLFSLNKSNFYGPRPTKSTQMPDPCPIYPNVLTTETRRSALTLANEILTIFLKISFKFSHPKRPQFDESFIKHTRKWKSKLKTTTSTGFGNKLRNFDDFLKIHFKFSHPKWLQFDESFIKRTQKRKIKLKTTTSTGSGNNLRNFDFFRKLILTLTFEIAVLHDNQFKSTRNAHFIKSQIPLTENFPKIVKIFVPWPQPLTFALRNPHHRPLLAQVPKFQENINTHDTWVPRHPHRPRRTPNRDVEPRN
jgi:hypothetical protein